MMKKEVIEILSSPEKEVGTALRPIFCLKSMEDVKQTEEVEDGFILEFDPFDSVDISKLSIKVEEDATDLSVIAEKGQVACRDYPHSRHLCLKFPFDTTPHENFCEQCYCYVCDCAAPCKYWILPNKEHCHASESAGKWKLLRQIWKQNPVDC